MSVERFDPETKQVRVRAYLVGPRGVARGYFLVDTGSQVTSVDPSLIDKAGYSVREGRRLSRLVGPGDEGSLGWVLRVDAIEAFGTRHESFDVHVHDRPVEDGIDGLLGMDWLLEHVLMFDGPGGTVELMR